MFGLGEKIDLAFRSFVTDRPTDRRQVTDRSPSHLTSTVPSLALAVMTLEPSTKTLLAHGTWPLQREER